MYTSKAQYAKIGSPLSFNLHHLTDQYLTCVHEQVWIILVGAVGLVIGLATYGYNVTRAMGVKLAKLSPTRGMCAELATALIIMIGAQYTLPTSSSQCIVGAIVGIGVMEGLTGVNWKQFIEQFASWVLTLLLIGVCTAAVFSQGTKHLRCSYSIKESHCA